MSAIALHEPRFLLHGVSWELYDQLLRTLGDQPVRMTYDRGELEFMSPLPVHERLKSTVRKLVEMLADELELDYVCMGSMTCRREDLERGLEPDECYYFQNESAVWNRDELDFRRDPPPDLAIEIDITSSSLDRQSIYAALRVPELWRYDGETLRVYHLKRGGYVQKESSLVFPTLPLKAFQSFLRQHQKTKMRQMVADYRSWMAQHLKRSQ